MNVTCDIKMRLLELKGITYAQIPGFWNIRSELKNNGKTVSNVM